MSSQLEDAFNEAVERRIREMQTIPLIDSLREVAAGMLPQVARFTLADIEDAADALPPGVWPDTSAQHGVLLDQIRELHQENERLRAASPDERLREALRTMIDVYDRHDRWCGHYAQAPGDGIIHRIDGARNALAAADREAHLEPAPQNDATRAQIVAAKLIADREAPDEGTTDA